MMTRYAILSLAICTFLPSSAEADAARFGDRGRDSATAWMPSSGNGVWGLSQFKVLRDDASPLGKIGSLLGQGFTTGWFPGDFQLDVIYQPLPPGSRPVAARRGTCTRVCALSVGAPQPGELFVITGFMAESTDGSRHEIQTLAVRNTTGSGTVEVELSGDEDFTYEAIVQGAFIPASSAVGGRVHAQTRTNTAPTSRLRFRIDDLEGDHGASILHGFEARFVDGAHALRHVTVRALREGGLIWFRDDDMTHVYEGTLEVVRLKS